MPLRRRGFPPRFAVTTAGIYIGGRSTGPHGPASAQPPRPPTPTQHSWVSPGFGGPLRPVNFRGPLPRRVSCYALLRGWQLLFPPPRCLRKETPFGLSLSGHFGALTRGLGCSPLGVRAYPAHPTPGIYGAHGFGVRKDGGPFRALTTPSVLYPVGCLRRGCPARHFGGN